MEKILYEIEAAVWFVSVVLTIDRPNKILWGVSLLWFIWCIYRGYKSR
jgi:hypothetical protein